MSPVAVYIEQRDGIIKRSSLEALTAARSISDAVIALCTHDASADQLSRYGATEIVMLDHPLLVKYSSQAVAAALSQYIRDVGVSTVIMGATSQGKELAPRLAALIDAAYLPDCVQIRRDNERLEVVRPLYAGKVRATVRPLTERVVLSLRPNMFTAQALQSPPQPLQSRFTPALNDTDRRVVVEEVVRNEGKLDVLEADIVVSGGRGMKGPEYFVLIEELAALLGGAVGASRAVVDAGWRPHSEQVGQTGKTVSPNLYLACGISGAVQHLAGMSSSKVIAAINRDKDAPIFKVADYGIVGDAFEVIPKLIEKIRELKHTHAS